MPILQQSERHSGVKIDSDIKFAIIPEWILFSDISPSAIRLYCTLDRHANNKTGECHPSRRTIADEMRCSTKTVDRAVAELEVIRALSVERRKRPDGEPMSNNYQLHPVPPDLRKG